MIFAIIFFIFACVCCLWLIGFFMINDFSVAAMNDFRDIKKALVIFPHPDDEVLTCGGLMALFREKGIDVTLLILTKGERGTPSGAADENLKKIREKEAKISAAIFGANVIHDDFGDGELSKKKVALSKAINKILEQSKPDIVVTYDQSGLYGHEDHIAVSDIVTKSKIRVWYASFPKKVLDKIRLPVHMSKINDLEKARKEPNLRVFVGLNVIKKIRSLYSYKSQFRSFRSAYPRMLPVWFYISMSLFEYFHVRK